MTKKYTLTTSEETVTENPEDIIRLMKLAGLSNAQAVAEEEVNEDVYEPTEANDELDLDDYSKKSPESISKQKKSIQPSHGDNPLEYSLDENEIYEAMMKEFNEIEEGKLPPGLQAYQDKKNGKKDEAVEETVEETDEPIEEAKGYKIRDKSRGHGVADETYKSREEAKYAAVMKGASSGSEWEVIEESKPDFLDLDKDGDKEESMKKAAKDKKEKVEEDGTTVSVSRKPAVTSKPVSSTDKANADATNAASDEKLIKKAVNRKRNYNDDGIAPPSGHHNNTSNRWAESVEEMSVSELKEAGNTKEEEIERIARLEKRIANLKKSNNDLGVELFQSVLDQAKRNVKNMSESELKEDCGCGHGSDCDCGPECDCGCNSVKESTDELSMQDAVNESQERLKYLISR